MAVRVIIHSKVQSMRWLVSAHLVPFFAQVVLTRRHLGIVMTYEAGGDLHVFCNKFKVDEVRANAVAYSMVMMWRW